MSAVVVWSDVLGGVQWRQDPLSRSEPSVTGQSTGRRGETGETTQHCMPTVCVSGDIHLKHSCSTGCGILKACVPVVVTYLGSNPGNGTFSFFASFFILSSLIIHRATIVTHGV